MVTIVLTRFFILLGTRFTSTQAKRIYTFVGVGSVAGAIGSDVKPRRISFMKVERVALRPVAPRRAEQLMARSTS